MAATSRIESNTKTSDRLDLHAETAKSVTSCRIPHQTAKLCVPAVYGERVFNIWN